MGDTAARPSHHRVLLKLSGEAFAAEGGSGISADATSLVARQLAEVVDLGIQPAVVVGGGNIWRGRQAPGIERNRADYMGMLATVMNALALQDALEKIHVPTRVQTAIAMSQIAEPFVPLRAIRHLEKGRVVIFAAGLGVPYFSTDTCAAQRALEIDADALLKGTKVDGVYTADPSRRLDRDPVRDARVRGLPPRGVPRDGRDGRVALHGEQAADHRVRPAPGGEHPPGGHGRAHRHGRPRRGRMTTASTMQEATHKMEQAVAHLKEELGSIRTGRATPAVLSRVTVEYYGTPVPLNQLASTSVPEPRLLQVQPFDKTALGAIEKAIQSSDLGITPSNDGNVIRLAFPPLTEERRRELVKQVHARAEEGRIAVRNVRRHAKDEMEKLEKEGSISQDDLVRAEKELQKLTDAHVAGIDEIQGHKEQELMEV